MSVRNSHKAGCARNPEIGGQRAGSLKFTAKVTTELESAVFTRQFALEEEAISSVP